MEQTNNSAGITGNSSVIDGANGTLIQAAKDYLWEHLEQSSKDLLLHIANTNSMAYAGREVKRLTINRNMIVGIDIKRPYSGGYRN